MTSQEEMVLVFGALHLVAAALGGLLLFMFMRSEETTAWTPKPEDDEPGGGGNDRLPGQPKGTPPGGIPLPHARQASMRLRGYGRLADAYPRRDRRTAPETPRRTPARPVPTRRP
ncbi:MAG TPA: hypothetical protein VF533_20200 [Solirubrobacteraceae bacterium]|jgi:hypothetical protein